MITISEERMKLAEEILNERWSINEKLNRNEDIMYYKGFVSALEQLGFDVKRSEDGTHKIFGNKK